MNPLRLYIENFMCHEKSYIDLSFNSASIIGKVDNNDSFSNGVGKSSIFKAIEYALFNEADVNLERIIRDDQLYCQVIIDFLINDQEYRIVRKRTNKGSNNLVLLQRTTVENNNDYEDPITKENIFWKDISGRRAADTEKELEKLIKINFKAFRSTQHFVQNDITGLPTATPEKRKAILKEAFGLVVYTKLKELTKKLSDNFIKDIDKHNILIETLQVPNHNYEDELNLINSDLFTKIEVVKQFDSEISVLNTKINILKNNYSNLESKFSSLLDKEKILNSEKSRLEISVKEYSTKKTNTSNVAKSIIDELKLLKEEKCKVDKLDYTKIDFLILEINKLKEKVILNNSTIKINNEKLEELNIPVPNDNICKHCRQSLTIEHKLICKNQIDKDILECQNKINESNKFIDSSKKEQRILEIDFNNLKNSQKTLENLIIKISNKEKEYEDKKSLHLEYNNLLNKFTNELKDKNIEISNLQEEIKISSVSEANEIKSEIFIQNNKINSINLQKESFIKDINLINNRKAVINHNIEAIKLNEIKLKELKDNLINLQNQYKVYPLVLQAFSSTGIPNLIIQNALDDLQIEANKLLLQLKPGLQLQFFVEKIIEKTGDQADTLDIKYYLNNKERYYESLSGAQKLSVAFSLKLGLSFLLQRIMGTDIKFLLLDEIDQSLDKASVEAFVDIVKFFQNEFKILVITHNDKIKDRFQSQIVVEQDNNMISRARLV